MHIIEEMVLFRNSQPVQHIELDTEKVEKSAALRKKTSTLAQPSSWSALITCSVNPFIRFMEDSMSHEESLHVQ